MARKRLPPGMITRAGCRGYYCDFWVNGRRFQKKLATDLKTATSILYELRARAEKADFGLLDNKHPLASLREDYLKHCHQVLKPRTVETYIGQLNNILT